MQELTYLQLTTYYLIVICLCFIYVSLSSNRCNRLFLRCRNKNNEEENVQ